MPPLDARRPAPVQRGAVQFDWSGNAMTIRAERGAGKLDGAADERQASRAA